MDRSTYFQQVKFEVTRLTQSSGARRSHSATDQEHDKRVVAEAERILTDYQAGLAQSGLRAAVRKESGWLTLEFCMAHRPVRIIDVRYHSPEYGYEITAYTRFRNKTTPCHGTGPRTDLAWTATAFEAFVQGQISSYLQEQGENPAEDDIIIPLPDSDGCEK